MQGSNRTDQLLQQVIVPKVKPSTTDGQTQQNLKVDISNVDVVQADTIQVTTLLLQRADQGTTTGGLQIGLSANGIRPLCNLTRNVGVGVQVAQDASNTSDNVWLGHQAGYNTRNVSSTVIIGSMDTTGQSMSNTCNSVQIGQQAGQTTTGPNRGNVAVGYRAARIAKGVQNVQLGTSAGSDVCGNSNVFIGAGAGSGINQDVDNTFLLTNSATLENGLLYGQFPTGSNSAQLGIGGFPSAGYALDVSGSGRIVGDFVIEGDLTVSGGPIGSDICTGQVVLGRGVPNSNYPSLLSLSGGALFNNGFVAINQDSNPNLYSLDVSGDAAVKQEFLVRNDLSDFISFTSDSINGKISNDYSTFLLGKQYNNNLSGEIVFALRHQNPIDLSDFYDTTVLGIRDGPNQIGVDNISLGINTSNPVQNFDVSGSGRITGPVRLNQETYIGSNRALYGAVNGSSYNLNISAGTATVTTSGGSAQVELQAPNPYAITAVVSSPNNALFKVQTFRLNYNTYRIYAESTAYSGCNVDYIMIQG